MILIQREFRVPADRRAEFEQRGREGLWPALLQFGAQMVAYGSWGFGGPADRLVTHTVYQDFGHWEATRPGGSSYRDEALRAEAQPFLDAYHASPEADAGLVEGTEVSPFELVDRVSRPQVFHRRAGQAAVALPPTFGVGSVISERTLALDEGTREEFIRVSADTVWPWLESQGGRAIGMGHNLMDASNEITTWFAFRSMSEWHRLSRPATAHAPQHVVDAFTGRARLVRHQRGRILVVATDFGTSV